MIEHLIDDISVQLDEQMVRLVKAVRDVEEDLRQGAPISERTELTVLKSAAGVIAAVGALRALMDPLCRVVPRRYPAGER